MTSADLSSIRESIERIERFSAGFPKRIECNDPRWQAFFDKELEWCLSQRNRLSTQSTDTNPVQGTILYG